MDTWLKCIPSCMCRRITKLACLRTTQECYSSIFLTHLWCGNWIFSHKVAAVFGKNIEQVYLVTCLVCVHPAFLRHIVLDHFKKTVWQIQLCYRHMSLNCFFVSIAAHTCSSYEVSVEDVPTSLSSMLARGKVGCRCTAAAHGFCFLWKANCTEPPGSCIQEARMFRVFKIKPFVFP